MEKFWNPALSYHGGISNTISLIAHFHLFRKWEKFWNIMEECLILNYFRHIFSMITGKILELLSPSLKQTLPLLSRYPFYDFCILTGNIFFYHFAFKVCSFSRKGLLKGIPFTTHIHSCSHFGHWFSNIHVAMADSDNVKVWNLELFVTCVHPFVKLCSLQGSASMMLTNQCTHHGETYRRLWSTIVRYYAFNLY